MVKNWGGGTGFGFLCGVGCYSGFRFGVVGVAFDFSSELAFLEIPDQLEEIDLVDTFSRQEFLFRDDAVCFLINVRSEKGYYSWLLTDIPSRPSRYPAKESMTLTTWAI